ncbi:hypothetical protein J6590_078940 [Homalodisca vitripennis]|nr:hypothetical protein J6590_078940 [Homalodisca vitripennis]
MQNHRVETFLHTNGGRKRLPNELTSYDVTTRRLRSELNVTHVSSERRTCCYRRPDAALPGAASLLAARYLRSSSSEAMNGGDPFRAAQDGQWTWLIDRSGLPRRVTVEVGGTPLVVKALASLDSREYFLLPAFLELAGTELDFPSPERNEI